MTDTITLDIAGHEVTIPRAAWEAVKADTPVPCTTEDQQDFALGLVEHWARAAWQDSDQALVARYELLDATSPEGAVIAVEIARRGLSD